MRRWLIVLLLALSVISIPRSTYAKELCFDQVKYCLNEPFTAYWETNGGLYVFGYPINVEAPEVNRDTGQTYNTQWLERNRFEVHPELAGTPYEILLGLLGKDRLAQIGRNWQAEPREAGPKSGCLWFEETGHNVCNQGGNLGFKTYWQTHGLKIAGLDNYARSLQLFGLPLTEPKMETNSSGDTVLTQWFERARFEWHPNNSDEYKVLLGLLGKEVHGEPSQNVGVVNERSYIDAVNTRWIVGEVANFSYLNQQNIKITAKLYNSANTLLASASSYAYADVLRPGRKSPFTVMFLNSVAAVESYTLQVEAVPTDRQVRDNFSISLQNRDAGVAGWRYLFGTVRNDTGVIVNAPKVMVTCYTNSGVVHQVGYAYAQTASLAPGQQANFEILLSEWADNLRCQTRAQTLNP